MMRMGFLGKVISVDSYFHKFNLQNLWIVHFIYRLVVVDSWSEIGKISRPRMGIRTRLEFRNCMNV